MSSSPFGTFPVPQIPKYDKRQDWSHSARHSHMKENFGVANLQTTMESSVTATRTLPSAQPGPSVHRSSEPSSTSSQFCCLYTKHKTQKRRVWHDGRLVLQSTRAILHSATPAPGSGDPILDECELSTGQRQTILSQQQENAMVETDKFLIQVEGPWVSASSTLPQTQRKSLSSSMQKLLTRKFQKPKAYIPPASAASDRLQAILGKRKRPLQPGELVRIHHGTATSRPTSFDADHSTTRGPHPNVPVNRARHPIEEPQSSTYQPLPSSSHIPQPYQPAPVQQNASEPMHQPNGVSMQDNPALDPIADSQPPAFQAATSQVPKAQQHSTRNGGMAFATNEFNSTSYYGLEEEEELDNGNPSTTDSGRQPLPFSFQPSSDPQVPGTEPANLGAPSPFQLLQSETEREASSGPGSAGADTPKPVTGDQLLDLFGATATPIQPTIPLQPPQPNSNDSPPPNSTDPSQAKEIQQTTFYLPPAGDSSSEEGAD